MSQHRLSPETITVGSNSLPLFTVNNYRDLISQEATYKVGYEMPLMNVESGPLAETGMQSLLYVTFSETSQTLVF